MAQSSPMDAFTQAYLEAALFSSTDENGRPLDRDFDVGDFAATTLAKMKSDAAKFQRKFGRYLRTRRDEGQAGHDFWLTRNGHGAGFWDGDWPEPAASVLDAGAKSFGEFNLYVTPRSKIAAYEVPARRPKRASARPNPSREQFATALRIFRTRVREGDLPAAEHLALTLAAMRGADFTERRIAPRVTPRELDAQIATATRLMLARRDPATIEDATLRAALLMAKRAQRRPRG